MRYDEIGLNSILTTHQRFVPGLGTVWLAPAKTVQEMMANPVFRTVFRTGQITLLGPTEFNFARAAATAAGMLVFLVLGVGASILVGYLAGPLAGVITAATLGGGFYIFRQFQINQLERLTAMNAGV